MRKKSSPGLDEDKELKFGENLNNQQVVEVKRLISVVLLQVQLTWQHMRYKQEEAIPETVSQNLIFSNLFYQV